MLFKIHTMIQRFVATEFIYELYDIICLSDIIRGYLLHAILKFTANFQ